MISLKRFLLVDGSTLVAFYLLCLVSDCVCFGRPLSIYIIPNKYVRAIVDNFTHGLASALATCFLLGWKNPLLFFIGLLSGSLIDLDHFIQIGAFSLHRVLNGKGQGRPMFHNSFNLLLLTLFIFLLEIFYFHRRGSIFFTEIFLFAWLTHHLRDAQRHGLTFLPFGQTAPIDSYLPLTVLMLKSLILHNLYLNQSILSTQPYAIEKLRSIWFENCKNVHFLLSIIEQQHLKSVVLRRSTCERTTLIDFLHGSSSVEYLDLGSLEILPTANATMNTQIDLPSSVKVCRVHRDIVEYFSNGTELSIRSLELVNITVDQFVQFLERSPSLQIVCLFLDNVDSSWIEYFQESRHCSYRIHLHCKCSMKSVHLPVDLVVCFNDEKFECFRYENIFKQNVSIEHVYHQ